LNERVGNGSLLGHSERSLVHSCPGGTLIAFNQVGDVEASNPIQ